MATFDELQFEKIIGRGHFAVVHKGKWNGKEVALKCIAIPETATVHSLYHQKWKFLSIIICYNL